MKNRIRYVQRFCKRQIPTYEHVIGGIPYISSLKRRAETVIIVLMCLFILAGCNEKVEIAELKFKNTTSNEVLESLNGKQVSITGYLSTLSPLNGTFAYLMNMPYQSCPFCIPGTSELSNTLAIYAKQGSRIEFTEEPVTVTGRLEKGVFTDEYGYEYGIKLSDVVISPADTDKLEATIKKYSVLAKDGLISRINSNISLADRVIYYNYYETPEENVNKIGIQAIKATISEIKSYNDKDYDILINLLQDLVELSTRANALIAERNVGGLLNLQPELDTIYYTFSGWMAESEL